MNKVATHYLAILYIVIIIAILLTGGNTKDGLSAQVEVLNSDGSYFCNLLPLQYASYGITQMGLISCGGGYSKSCFLFSAGNAF